MEYRQLGRTDLNVSAICLGTMTWGEQNTESEAFAQIEHAKAAGINFMDTAEMYPVPPKAETYASTERIIGNWFKQRGDRDQWVLASKIAGPGNGISYIRDRNLKHNRRHIVEALDARATSTTPTRRSRRSRTPSKPWTNRSRPAKSATSACPTKRRGAP